MEMKKKKKKSDWGENIYRKISRKKEQRGNEKIENKKNVKRKRL